MSHKPNQPKLARIILFGLVYALAACQTFNISILAPTESAATEGLMAATFPAEWTATPIPENLLPLESLTPQAPEAFTQGPAWESPELDPMIPEFRFELGEFVNFVKVAGGYLYVGDNSGTLTILDLFNPGNPRPIVNINLGYEDRVLSIEPGDPLSPPEALIATEVRDVEVEDDRLYVITLNRLLVFDLDTPGDPEWLGELQLPPRLQDLSIEDAYVRVLTALPDENEVQLLEIDALFPEDLEIASQVRFPGTGAGRARISELQAFVTDRTLENAEHFKIYELEGSGEVTHLGEAYGAPAFHAWVVGDYAYISTGRVERVEDGGYQTDVASIWVVDISDPEEPASYSYIWAPDIATDFHITEEYAFAIGDDLQAGTGYAGVAYWLIVADMSDPQFPVVNRTLEFPGQPMGISAARGVTYVAAGLAGLQILAPVEGEAIRRLDGEDFRADHQIEAGYYPITLAPPIPTGQPLPLFELTPPATNSAEYLDFYIDEYRDFTVYWRQGLWEPAVDFRLVWDGFEQEPVHNDALDLPYETGLGVVIEGDGLARMLYSEEVFTAGNHIELREWSNGFTFRLPGEISVEAFGFVYRSQDEWLLSFTGGVIRVPRGREGFIGIIYKGAATQSFHISAPPWANTNFSLDNIIYTPTDLTFPSSLATATARAQPYPTGTPTPGGFDD